MTDKLTEAIERAEGACPHRSAVMTCCANEYGERHCACCVNPGEHRAVLMRTRPDIIPFTALPVDKCRWPGHAAIHSIAEIVGEYGHVAGGGCADIGEQDCSPGEVEHERDSRCLPPRKEAP